MHAHHKNLLRDFWLISPGKTPTGKTSQRGEILISSAKYMTEKYTGNLLISQQIFISKIWSLCTAKKHTSRTLNFCALNLLTVQHKNPAVLPWKPCQINAVCASKTVQEIYCSRTSISVQPYLGNCAAVPRNSCHIKCWPYNRPYTDFWN